MDAASFFVNIKIIGGKHTWENDIFKYPEKERNRYGQWIIRTSSLLFFIKVFIK